MTHQERDRIGISLVLAIAIHTVIIVGVSLADWDIREYPESRPVFVELLDYESAPPAPEPIAEEPEPVVEEPEPVAPEPEPVPVPEPQIVPEPTPQVTQQAPAQSTARTQQQPQSTPPSPPAATGPEYDFSNEPLVGIPQDRSVDRNQAPPPAEDLFTFDEPSESGELPAWVEEGTIQPLSTLPETDQQALADKGQDVPEFDRLLGQVLSSLESRDSNESASTRSGDTPGSNSSSDNGVDLPGDSALEWLGGSRRPVPPLAPPVVTAEDFGGRVPARITYVVVFDVNADGLVVPGSLIVRQGSGYTRADQKVRSALSRWRFEPAAPGSPAVTAICTLIIERDDIR